MSTISDTDHARLHLWEIVRGTRFAMVTTHDAGGELCSRPLTTQNEGKDFGDTLQFFVPAESDVARQVAADSRVGVTFADTGKDRYISISGSARVVQDMARQRALWSPLAQAWFPGGASDPLLRLLEVRMDSAEYWDVESSKMVQLLKMAKAAITRKPPSDIGEHRDVAMR